MRLSSFPDCFATVDRHGYEVTQKRLSATCWKEEAVRWRNSWEIRILHARKILDPLAQNLESTPVCWKPADTISEVLNFKDFPHFAQKIGRLTGVCL